MNPDSSIIVTDIIGPLLISALVACIALALGTLLQSNPVARRLSFKALTRRAEWVMITVHARLNPTVVKLFGGLSADMAIDIGDQLAAQLEGNSAAALLCFESAYDLMTPRI